MEHDPKNGGGEGARFTALRFTADANLSDRTYWYLCEFPVETGDTVFAPVGARNRVQRAVVERVVTQGVPYDPALCKHVSAKCGQRERRAGSYLAYEMGGIALDGRHYTAFGRVLISPETPQTLSVLPMLHAETLVPAEEKKEWEALSALAGAKGCALLCGAGAKGAAELLLSLTRRQSGQWNDFLTEEEIRALRCKLDAADPTETP